jgi:phosphoribosylformylglycinamidine (FGAM) synthase-like enzyme
MVGELPDAARAGRSGFRTSDPAHPGDVIALVGPFAPDLAASELAKLRGERLPDGLPEIDIAAVRAAQAAVRGAVRSSDVSSAHDIAEGGLLIAVAESCLAGGVGATLELPGASESDLFGEGAGGFVVSGPADALQRLAERADVRVIGTVGGDALVAGDVRATLAELREAHGALAPLFP